MKNKNLGRLEPGVRFDTESERGCLVQTSPDADGNFDGVDSDGVEVTFTVRMIKRLLPSLEETQRLDSERWAKFHKAWRGK